MTEQAQKRDAMSAALNSASNPVKKVPKVVAQIQKELEINPASPKPDIESIKNVIGKSKYNLLGCTFRQSLTQEQKQAYQGLTQEQKDDALVQVVLDPNECNLLGFNKTSVYKDDVNEDVEIWVTEAQLGGPQYLNNPEHAALIIFP